MQQNPELAEALNWAVNQWEASRPRTLQAGIGTSELGGCREYMRATIAGDERLPPKERGLDGAAVGTIVGDGLEKVFAQELGYRHQVPITVRLHDLGLEVSGHADLVHEGNNEVSDLKSVDGLEETRRQGPSLKYLIQISVYALGLVQAGVLNDGATANLFYCDRSGTDKKFLVYTITWDEILGYVSVAEQRIQNVFDALDAGSPDEMRWRLRDEEPSFCHYIACPFRLSCWGGSDWVTGQVIESDEGVAAVESYVDARDAAKQAEAWKKSAREGLRGRQGVVITKTGKWSVSWKGAEGRERLDVLPM